MRCAVRRLAAVAPAALRGARSSAAAATLVRQRVLASCVARPAASVAARPVPNLLAAHTARQFATSSSSQQAGEPQATQQQRQQHGGSSAGAGTASFRWRTAALVPLAAGVVGIVFLSSPDAAKCEGQEAAPGAASNNAGFLDSITNGIANFRKAAEVAIWGENSTLMQQESTNIRGELGYTLVLGFNHVVVNCVWTREEGWRIRKRPHMDNFLAALRELGFEVVVWCKDQQTEYEGMVQDWDHEMHFPHRFFREHMNLHNEGYHFHTVKDLARLNRNLKRVILIDADTEVAAKQPGNLVLVEPFRDQVKDNELMKLLSFLVGVDQFKPTDVTEKIKLWNETHDARQVFARERQEAEEAHKARQEQKQKERKAGSRSWSGFSPARGR